MLVCLYPSSENNHRGSHKIVFSFFFKYIRRRYSILPIFFSSMHNRLEFDCRSNVTLFFKVDGIIELNWWGVAGSRGEKRGGIQCIYEKNPISPSFGVALLLNVGGRNLLWLMLSLLFFAFPPSIFQWLATNYLPTANHRATDGPGIRCLATLSKPIFYQGKLVFVFFQMEDKSFYFQKNIMNLAFFLNLIKLGKF